MRFDELDRALLHALQIDGRAPFRRVGSVLGVSDQTVARRYARLRAAGALRVLGLTAPAATGDVQWILRIRAQPGAAAEVAEALARRPDTSWVSLCTGGTEIIGTVYGTGVDALLLDALPRTRQVQDVAAHRVLRIFFGGAGQPYAKHGPLSAEQVEELAAHLPAPGPPPVLDDTDHRMLEVLHGDGRAPVERLTAATGVSQPTVRRRLHDLRAGGVLHLDVDVDPGAIDLPLRTMLWLGVAPGSLDAAGRALAGHAPVAFATAVTGSSSIFATVATPDVATLYDYLTTEVAALPGIRDVATAPVLRTVKAAGTYRPAPSR